MSTYILLLTGFGLVVLLTAWLPMMLKEIPLSLPIACVGIGALAAGNLELPSLAPHPQQHLKATERLTEAVVIVALMGAGLKLDRSLRWAKAVLTWRLLIVAMPLTIALIALLSSTLLGLGTAAALLLGAALAPTDPVLASDVQVGPPRSGEEDEVRFTLTAEAGLNDGLAFPFVNLAIALAAASQTSEPWLMSWLTVDVLWKLVCGVAVGCMVGRVLGWLTFRLPNRAKLSRTGDGFVALGITAVAYGLTELAHGYGFLAVFCAAASFRTVEQNHAYHEKLHEFIEQLERLLMMILLVLFGGAISSGNLLGAMDGAVILFALLVLFIVRPACGWISLVGLSRPLGERGAISFFGVRGLGSA
ncbi:cation transporter, partial [Methylobacterium frigidaeris]